VPIFDANHPSLLPPDDMPKRIAALCAEAGGAVPHSPAEFARSIVESLAEAYATAIDDAERLSGSKINTVHVVGGGSQNTLLCQLTANRTGRRVLAGPVEATAVGNVLIQGRAAGLVKGELRELRSLVATTFPPVEYQPQGYGSEAEVINVSLHRELLPAPTGDERIPSEERPQSWLRDRPSSHRCVQSTGTFNVEL
jgi:rhamnulokinase